MNTTVDFVLTGFPKDVGKIVVWALRKAIQAFIDSKLSPQEMATVLAKMSDKVNNIPVTYVDALEQDAVESGYNIFNGLIVKFKLVGLEKGVANVLKEASAHILIRFTPTP